MGRLSAKCVGQMLLCVSRQLQGWRCCGGQLALQHAKGGPCRGRRLHIVICRHMLCLDHEQVGLLSLLPVSAVCRLFPAIIWV